jgi:hypothetical protein
MKCIILVLTLCSLSIACSDKPVYVIQRNEEKSEAERKKKQAEQRKQSQAAWKWASQGANDAYRNFRISDVTRRDFERSTKDQPAKTVKERSLPKHDGPSKQGDSHPERKSQ